MAFDLKKSTGAVKRSVPGFIKGLQFFFLAYYLLKLCVIKILRKYPVSYWGLSAADKTISGFWLMLNIFFQLLITLQVFNRTIFVGILNKM